MRRTLTALLLSLSSAMAVETSQFRGDPSHPGIYAAPDKPISGKIAWSYEGLGWDLYQTLEGMDGTFVFPTTPAVSGGRIYFAAGPFLFVVDESGKPVYRVKLSSCTLASPSVSGGLVYLPTDDGKLHALSEKDGSEIWTASIGTSTHAKQVDAWDVYHSSAAVVDGSVYVGGADGAIYALSAVDGKERWHFKTGHVVRATPTVVGGRVFCGSFDGKIYALDAASGRELWTVDTNTKGRPWHAVQASCTVADGIVYVGSRSTFLYAIEAATGKLSWKLDFDGSWVPSSATVRDGTLYVGQSDGSKVSAISTAGVRQWSFSPPNETFGSPALAGDVLYVSGNDNYNMRGKGSLSALDIKTGKALWTLELPASVWTSPVIVNGTLYIGCADNRLYAIR